MNYTQNSKIAQVTESTLVVGVDIGSEMNFARAFNWRGQELSKKVFRFSNSLEGFQSFLEYLKSYQTIASTEQIIVGCEPTGHYWFNLARYLNAQHINLALVNPYHVKQIKELDDNSPKKTDLKDPENHRKAGSGWPVQLSVSSGGNLRRFARSGLKPGPDREGAERRHEPD